MLFVGGSKFGGGIFLGGGRLSHFFYINIKQHSQVTNLRCILDERISCEPMTLKVVNKINGRLKFLYRKNR